MIRRYASTTLGSPRSGSLSSSLCSSTCGRFLFEAEEPPDAGVPTPVVLAAVLVPGVVPALAPAGVIETILAGTAMTLAGTAGASLRTTGASTSLGAAAGATTCASLDFFFLGGRDALERGAVLSAGVPFPEVEAEDVLDLVWY